MNKTKWLNDFISTLFPHLLFAYDGKVGSDNEGKVKSVMAKCLCKMMI